MSKRFSVTVLSFSLAVLFYMIAVFSSFSREFPHSELDPSLIVLLSVLGGLVSLGLGYGSVVGMGGKMSLRLGEFIARLNGSRHVIEVIDRKAPPTGNRFGRVLMLIMFGLVFLISLALAWDIHTLQNPRAGIFHPLLHFLDVFARPTGTDPVAYFTDILPVMLVLTAVAGLVPAMVLPYFRGFKITGVNSGPFHTNLLLTIAGSTAGLSVIMTLARHLLAVAEGNYYYDYILLTMLGLSLDYTLGSFLGRDRSEGMVKTMLNRNPGTRIVLGTVNILETVRTNREAA